MSRRPEPQERFFREASKLLNLQRQPVFSLFDLIQAPPNLKSFFGLLPNLPEILQTCVAICEASEDLPDHFETANRTASTLFSLFPQFEKNPYLQDLQPTPTARHGSYTGILESHPLYSFLGGRVRQKNLSRRFVQLQAQVLLAVESLGPPEGALLETLLTPFRRLRELADLTNWPKLERLPGQIISTDEFFRSLQRNLLDSEFQPISRVFILAQKGFSPRIKKPWAPKENTSRPQLGELEEDEDRTSAYIREVHPTTTLSETEAREYAEHAGLAQELGDDADQEPVLHKDRYQGPTHRQLAFQAKQANNQRALLNQFSPQAWNQANLFDLQVLFEFLEGTRSLPEVVFAPLGRDETAALLGLVFFTSNSFERILALPVFPEDQPKFNSPEGLYWRKGTAPLVRFHSPGPQLASRSNSQVSRVMVIEHLDPGQGRPN